MCCCNGIVRWLIILGKDLFSITLRLKSETNEYLLGAS